MPPRPRTDTIRFLTLDELGRLLAYRHGLRASEVGLLRAEDLDLRALRLTVHRLKGSHSGTHPLQPDETKALRAWLRERPQPPSPVLFPSNRGDPIARRTLDWLMKKYGGTCIRRQYDEMVKYATALRLGTAEAEAILRRFTRENAQHPTYKALVELGKAVKTVFLARYLHDRALRVEINDGLNVIEQWNGANDFIFFARRGEVSSNRREDQELNMLGLHLLQNCMIYVNTLMVQKVLARPAWKERLTARATCTR